MILGLLLLELYHNTRQTDGQTGPYLIPCGKKTSDDDTVWSNTYVHC